MSSPVRDYAGSATSIFLSELYEIQSSSQLSLSLSLSLSLCLSFAFFLFVSFYLFVSSSFHGSLLTNDETSVLHLVRAHYARRNADTRGIITEKAFFFILYSIRVRGRKAKHFKLELALIRALLLLDLTKKREGQ